ncbi:unnamed protein product [Boreogadus saida]
MKNTTAVMSGEYSLTYSCDGRWEAPPTVSGVQSDGGRSEPAAAAATSQPTLGQQRAEEAKLNTANQTL